MYSAALLISEGSSLSFPSAVLHDWQSSALTLPVACQWSTARRLCWVSGWRQMAHLWS